MTFYIQRDGQPKQFPIEKLVEMVKNGSLKSDEYVFDGRTQKWVGATQLPELAGAWSQGRTGAAAAPAAAAPVPAAAAAPVATAAPATAGKSKSKKFSETSWFMSAVTFEEGGLTPSELPPMEAGDKFENLPPVPEELRRKFSLSIADLDDGKKKK